MLRIQRSLQKIKKKATAIKGMVIAIAIILIALSTISISSCTKSRAPEKGITTCVIGNVWITRPNMERTQLKVQNEIKKGDVINTDTNAFAIIQIGDTKLVRIESNTTISVSSKLITGKQEFSLDQGQVMAKLKKLQKNESFKITTPTMIAAVRGTTFGVSYSKNRGTVATKSGKVEVSHIAEDKNLMVETGNTIVITDKAEMRTIELTEDLELSKIDHVEFNQNIEAPKSDELNKIQQKVMENDKKIDEEIRLKTIPQTLEKIREKFGRIDEVSLFDGRVIKGAIIKRGPKWKMVVPGRYIFIRGSKIRYTK